MEISILKFQVFFSFVLKFSLKSALCKRGCRNTGIFSIYYLLCIISTSSSCSQWVFFTSSHWFSWIGIVNWDVSIFSWTRSSGLVSRFLSLRTSLVQLHPATYNGVMICSITMLLKSITYLGNSMQKLFIHFNEEEESSI